MVRKYIVNIFLFILFTTMAILSGRFILLRTNPSVNYLFLKNIDNEGVNNTEKIINIANTYPLDFFETEVCAIDACTIGINNPHKELFAPVQKITEFNYFNFDYLYIKLKEDDINIFLNNIDKSNKFGRVEGFDYRNEESEVWLSYDKDSIYISSSDYERQLDSVEIKEPNITREILLKEDVFQENPDYLELILAEDKKVQEKLEEIIELSEGYDKPDKYYEKSKKVSDEIEYEGYPIEDYTNWLIENGYK